MLQLVTVSFAIASLPAQTRGSAREEAIGGASIALRVRENVPAPAVVNDLNPFIHAARIPVTSELSSIRFQGIRAVRIPTSIRSTAVTPYCEEAAFRDPGGSMYCPFVQPEQFVRAYEVTYLFDGAPLGSDEYGSRQHAFSVYFRPEELDPIRPEALMKRKGARAEAAGFFQLRWSRDMDERLVIDEERSTFCNGNYIDGSWVHADPKCEDAIRFKAGRTPSEYITVSVELAVRKPVMQE
jgi:hypothetical protein